MRQYLFDTSIVAGLLSGRAAVVDRAAPWIRRDEAATSILVYAEVIEYLRGRQDFAARARNLRSLMRDVYLFSVTYDIADRYSLVRRALRPPYGPGLIGDIDTLIAATALARDLTIVTADSDFLRVPDLKVMTVPLRR